MEIESFFGVYLLYNENPQFKGRTYIGYTVNPNRRIRQHNVGKHAGGAKRTHGKGPWAMALIVHGFPNDISALRFEWAWQNPEKSRILKPLNVKKSRKETAFEYRFRVVQNMLRTGPWNRLSLTIRWLLQDYQLEFNALTQPPDHMAVAYGPVKSVKVANKTVKRTRKRKVQPNDALGHDLKSRLCGNHGNAGKSRKLDVGNKDNDTIDNVNKDETIVEFVECVICRNELPLSGSMSCYAPNCDMTGHIRCLARCFLRHEPDEVIPLRGDCPSCGGTLLWGELVRYKEGCYRDPTKVVGLDDVHQSEDESDSQ